MNNIKDYRENELKQYVIATSLLFLLLHGFIDFSNPQNIDYIKGIVSFIGTSILTSVIYIFTLVIDGVMDDKLKNVIVNLCLMKLPGEYIFTEIKAKNKDIRFTTEEALQRFSAIYSNIPTNAREKRIYENSQWYKIYSKYREKPVIFISNRNYLLMRDMYISTFVILMLYIMASFLLKWFSIETSYIVYLLTALILTNIATHIKAKRFAYNVIALEIADKREEK